MKKLLIIGVFLNAGFLFAIWQQLSVVAEVGSGAGVDSPCEGDATQYSLDSNADGAVDLSDFVYGLSWLFSGTEAPRVCLATNDLEARISTLEASSINNGEARVVALETARIANEGRMAALENTVETVDISVNAIGARLDATEILTIANSESVSAISVEVAETYDGFLGVMDRLGVGGNFPDNFSLNDLLLGDASILQWTLALLDVTDVVPTDEFEPIGYNAQGLKEYEHIATRQGGQVGTGLVFVLLWGTPTGFLMGSPETEFGHDYDESPRHYVKLNPFLIAKYEVTQLQYELLMAGTGLDTNPSMRVGDLLPVEQVSWDDLHVIPYGFLAKYNLSLPTEAQWEYACRAGTPGPYSGTGNLGDMGWYANNSDGVLRPVGTKQANHFGLHDMHGNVAEHCEDAYKSDFYNEPEAQLPNPLVTSGSGSWVYRGGHFSSGLTTCRSADRRSLVPSTQSPYIGFRPVRSLP